MTRQQILTGVAALVVVAGISAIVFLRPHGGDADDQGDKAATAVITTAPIVDEQLQDVTSLYGVVQADPAASHALAAPRALIVDRVLVRPGQSVAPGQALAEITSTATSDLAYRQAADAATFARSDLARVQRLFDEHLAASDQLAQAKKAVADADAALASQQQMGADRTRQVLTAGEAAVVVSVAASAGDHVAQDAPLMVLARTGALSVKLGVEPGAGLASGDPVTIRPAGGGPQIGSRLDMVGHAADGATHTIDAIAPLPGAASLAVGAGVKADVVTGAHRGLAAPRAAVVFDESGTHVFVIAGGKARRVFVTAGRDHGDQIEISGPVKAGQIVAVQGAYELQDGMAVKVAAP
jgi:RND family efflux transporter MFP subunit